MHQAMLVGQCAADDVACSRRHPQAPIAIGTRFYPEVSTEVSGTTTPTLRLESAAPDVIAVEDGALVARKAGASAVLLSTDDGSVVDFVHVWVAPATRLSLSRRDGDRISGAVALAVGEDLTLVPALWNGAQRLSGAGDLQWTASGPADAAHRARRFAGHRAGPRRAGARAPRAAAAARRCAPAPSRRAATRTSRRKAIARAAAAPRTRLPRPAARRRAGAE